MFTGIFVPEALVRFRGLSSGAKLAYGWLTRYSGEGGDCFPSIPTLAREIGVGATQARVYVHELRDKGFIIVEPRPGTSGIYTFLWHPAFQGEIGERQKRPPLRKTGDEESQLKESHSKASESAANSTGKQTTHTTIRVGSRAYILAGWSSSEDFEVWWTQLVWKHQNKNRNAAAKTLAIELIQGDQLKRSDFEEGYGLLATTNLARWAEEHGRYSPNLYQVLGSPLDTCRDGEPLDYFRARRRNTKR